ncbi:hypothetical protein N8987_04195 [Crocinitomix sp.]|nr:hypothetical protein [Crocinitomix sp.]
MIQKYTYILLLLVSFASFAQEPDKDDGGVVMRRDFLFGLNFNANSGSTGWGMGFEYGIQKNYKYRRTFGFTLTNIRHPKEFKIYNDLSSSRGYFFGKLNSLVSFRPTYGGKLVLFQAKRENGIEITYKWAVGPSIGLVKPVYLKILKFGNNTVDEQYDPSAHNTENIASRSPWTIGLSEATLNVGGFFKTGFDFNFSNEKNKISGGEIGLMVDYFPLKSLHLLNNNPERNLFTSIYLQFNLGQKLY